MARTLSEWLSWQESLHFSSIDLGLERVRVVAENLNLLTLPFPLISIAGTNGKGSSTAMLHAIYHQACYTTGVYTSPHLLHYNERIAIAGKPARDTAICRAFEKIEQARGDISLTYFEFGTLAAVLLFVEAQVDIAILEVGLGGRLDAVNLWDADIALITSIAIDHESWLGNNREVIAIEKAGIMRSDKPVICGDKNSPSTIASEAHRIGATLIQRDRDFSLSINEMEAGAWIWEDLRSDLRYALPFPSLAGTFQLDNAANVIAAITHLQHILPVPVEAMQQGLQHTSLSGRLQRVSQCPEIIVDVAHNPHAAEQLALYLAHTPVAGKTIALFSILKDKDFAGVVIPLRSIIDEWHVVTVIDPRGMTAAAIKYELGKQDIDAPIMLYADFKTSVQALKNTLKCEDRVVAFGSFLVVSSVLESLSTT